MSEVESVGELVTGGLIAGAVEPAAGEAGPKGEGACLNCGTGLTGPYCSACGQKARVHRSLATFLHDMVQGLFNFEGKIWRTLPMLAWRPGEMTRRYIDGQRARFVSPVGLYLFTVFLMFAVLNFTGGLDAGPNAISGGIATAAKEERAELARLQKARAAVAARGANVVPFDRRIATKLDDIAELERVRRGNVIETRALDEDDAPRWVVAAVERIQRNPQAFVGKLQDATSKFSWLLIPLSVPFLWLLFPFSRRYHLYDHTVFVTYSLAFMMMLVIAGGLLVSLGAAGVSSFLFFVPPIHMYRQLRGAYQLSRINAVVRTLVLMIFSFVVCVLFFLAILGIGLID